MAHARLIHGSSKAHSWLMQGSSKAHAWLMQGSSMALDIRPYDNMLDLALTLSTHEPMCCQNLAICAALPGTWLCFTWHRIALHGVNGCIMSYPMHGNVPFATHDARYGRFCRLDARLDGQLDAQHGRLGLGRTEASTMGWVHVIGPLCVWDKAEGVVWADNTRWWVELHQC